MTEIPTVYLDLLLEKKALAHLATVMPDGSPQNTPVWFDYVDGKIRVNSAFGRVKVRNMKQGAKVALSILDPDNPDRYVQLRGTVTRVRQDDVATAHIDQLAHKYMGLGQEPLCQGGRCARDVRDLRVLSPGHELAARQALRGSSTDRSSACRASGRSKSNWYSCAAAAACDPRERSGARPARRSSRARRPGRSTAAASRPRCRPRRRPAGSRR